jgi:hypothetical protein
MFVMGGVHQGFELFDNVGIIGCDVVRLAEVFIEVEEL